MHVTLWLLAAALLGVLLFVWATQRTTSVVETDGGAAVQAEPGKSYRWSFDEAAGPLPADFIAILGDWRVEAEPTAPSAPNVLRQKGGFRRPDFPRCVVRGWTFSDLTLRVRCRPEAGRIDQACGVLFRFQDSRNYYITRANALEGNIRLYRVVDDRRQQFGTASRTIAAGVWHTLEVTARDSTITVRWDGEEVISETDPTFVQGKVGLWTKADSISAFDDLEATAE